MKKKHVNLVFDSVLISVLLFFVIVLLVASAYGCYTRGHMTGFITSICLYGIAALATLAVLLFGCYEYWYVDEDVVIARKIIGKQKMIPRSQIKRIERTEVRTLLNYNRDAYVIYSPYGVVTIFITKKNAELLHSCFAA